MIFHVCRRLAPVCLVFVAATYATAQSPPSGSWYQHSPQTRGGSSSNVRQRYSGSQPWWKNEQFKKDLGLTNEQSAQIDKIFVETNEQQRKRRVELETAEDLLSSMIQRDAPLDKITGQLDAVESIRSAMNKARTLMLYQMRLVISPAQRQQFDLLHAKWRRDVGAPTLYDMSGRSNSGFRQRSDSRGR